MAQKRRMIAISYMDGSPGDSPGPLVAAESATEWLIGVSEKYREGVLHRGKLWYWNGKNDLE
jgi:hypothetical protein